MSSLSATIVDAGVGLECVSVLLPLPLGRAYTYAVSADLSAKHPLKIGDFGSQKCVSSQMATF